MAALVTTAATVAAPLADLVGALVPADDLGDTAEVGPGYVLVVSNVGAAPATATIANPRTVQGLAVDDGTLTVAAGDMGMFPLVRLFRGSAERAAITYDDATDLVVGVVRLEV